MSERNSKGQFVKGNTLGKIGRACVVEKHFNGDKIAYRAYLSVIGRRGWDALVEKRFAGDEKLAKAYLEALGKYAYGKAYQKPDGTYPSWVKSVFREKIESPEDFLQKYEQRFSFNLSEVGELQF